jgi:glucose/mannose-6-phosphate isomerase
MLDLDNFATYEQVDRAHMHLRLTELPQQCLKAYRLAQALALPHDYRSVNTIVIAAMGGSALGGAIAQALATPLSQAPITIWRQYGLPAFAQGAGTLVIASSKSGDTEETISAFDEAVRRDCHAIAIATGGALAHHAIERQIPLFSFTFAHESREAIGWLTLPVIAFLSTMGIIPDPTRDIIETVTLLGEMRKKIGIGIPAAHNSAKRMAGQLMDRLPIIYGAEMLAPVAQRWKTVLNENAKMLAAWDEMPELSHNTVVGFEHAEAIWSKSIVIQLRSNLNHPGIARRFDLTTRLLLEAGINQDTVRAQGNSAMAQLFSLVYFGDWVSYYAAIISGIDPTPTNAIHRLKGEVGY